ncbi:MAG: enoyl-CoA hydratase/isomerase family protein [Pseudomonadota bacterium]
MSTDEDLLVLDEGPVRHLRFNRPERLNAIDLAQHERIMAQLDEAARDPAVRVVVFSGEGRAFCAGDDMKGAGALPPRWQHRDVDLDIGIGPLLLLEAGAAIRRMDKATVALMHGHALGAGFDYSLSCDFRLAADDLNYGDPRIHRAMWAAEGWSYKLVRLLNQSMVTPICYLGETMTARRALEIGLVHRIYPAGEDLRRSAAPFLEALASLDPEVYRQTKRRMLDGLDTGYRQALHYSP